MLPSLLRGQRIWEGAAVLLVLALFGRTVGFGWVYDDQMEIVLNPMVQSLQNFPHLFTTTVWAGSGMETYLYRPLALVSYSLNHMLSGLAPWSYHLVNVLLHAGLSVMIIRLGRLWGLPLVAAGLAGLFFAFHPIHTEVVAAVFGRKDLLATLLVVAMALLHPRAVEAGGWRMALPILAYAGAMLSKEVGAVGLLLVAAQDGFLVRGRKALLQNPIRTPLYVAYGATLLTYVLVRNQVTGGVGVPDTFYMDNPLVQAPLGIRLATALAVVGKGLALQLLPFAQSPDYSYNAIPLVQSVLDFRFLGSVVALALLTWALVANRARRPALALGILWYGVAILPTANLVVLVGTIFGERLLFLPSVAFCLVAGLAGGWLLTRTRWGPVLVLGWSALLVVQNLRYVGAFSDDISLFRAAVASVPNSTKANHKLGEELLRAGQVGAALPHLREALLIAPDNEFASLTLSQARGEVARRYLPQAPESPRPEEIPAEPEILYTLGDLTREGGNLDAARAYWEQALAVDPGHPHTLADLGLLVLTRGDTATAERHLRRAVEIEPRLARAWYNLGRIHLARGNRVQAQRALTRFIEESRGRFPQQVAWAREVLSRLSGS